MEAIDQYIESQPSEFRPVLRELAKKLRAALPGAEERISYQMPTFWQGQNIIHFAPAKKHLGIYPGPAPIIHFADRLAEYKTSKGAIQIPWDTPVPYNLIIDIAQWNVEQVQ